MSQLPAILQMLSGQNTPLLQNPQLGQLRQMISTLKNAGNPQALMQQMLQQNNPAMSQALAYIKQNGGNPKAACEKLAAEKGISLSDIGL